MMFWCFSLSSWSVRLLFVFGMKAQFGQPRVLKALLMSCFSFTFADKEALLNHVDTWTGLPFEMQQGIGQTKNSRNLARTLSPPTLLLFPKKLRRTFNENNIPVHSKPGNTETEVGPQSDAVYAVQHTHTHTLVNARTSTLEQTNNLSTSAWQ